MQEEKSLLENLTEKIKTGQIKMKPKFYFVLKTILLFGLLFIVSGLILFLISLVYFYLKSSGVGYAFNFGFKGMGIYLKLLPWVLIFVSLLLIIILEILAKHFAFVWRKPIFYSLLFIIFISIFGGYLFSKTDMHYSLFMRSYKNKLPIITPIYNEFGPREFKNIHRGIVEEISENSFKIKNFRGNILEIIIDEKTDILNKEQIKEGDSVVIIGNKEGKYIKALGIKKVDDNFRFFEKEMHKPFNMNMKNLKKFDFQDLL